MSTLLLRLAGPLQAWGTGSRFEVRGTDLEPSKSGVVGMLAAALGRPREADVSDLAGLRMGVRIDREPVPIRDFHTIQNVARVAGRESRGGEDSTVVSERWYLADADFLVGLEGTLVLLQTVEAALRRPRFAPTLGRRSCLPSLPVTLPPKSPDGPGIRGDALEDALATYPWRPIQPWRQHPPALRTVVETRSGAGDGVRHDQPVGAAFRTRRFVSRWVRTGQVPTPVAEVP
ncbi:MAG: type I-E CRISPR-associated protein Cas5/CasD [Solirubrobacterales bacterium]